MTAHANPPASEPASAPSSPQKSPPQRILVVDDDADIRSLNTEVLIHHGFHVDAAEDGAVAWKSLIMDHYDLMITDHDMPHMTGIELLKALRGARMALPVIMATEKLPKWEFTRHPWLEPAATLIKPYSIAELVGTVRAVLRATNRPSEQTTLPLIWPSQPSTARLRS